MRGRRKKGQKGDEKEEKAGSGDDMRQNASKTTQNAVRWMDSTHLGPHIDCSRGWKGSMEGVQEGNLLPNPPKSFENHQNPSIWSIWKLLEGLERGSQRVLRGPDMLSDCQNGGNRLIFGVQEANLLIYRASRDISMDSRGSFPSPGP